MLAAGVDGRKRSRIRAPAARGAIAVQRSSRSRRRPARLALAAPARERRVARGQSAFGFPGLYPTPFTAAASASGLALLRS